jgi:hypothetical protein
VTAKPAFASRHAGDHLVSALIFAAVMLALPASVKLASALGVDVDVAIGRRLTMIVFGLFFAYTGNAMPKMVTPLSQMSCDPARVQAFQRFAGWVWVLTGLFYAGVWILAPIPVANPLSTLALVFGIVAVVARLIRLRRGQ